MEKMRAEQEKARSRRLLTRDRDKRLRKLVKLKLKHLELSRLDMKL